MTPNPSPALAPILPGTNRQTATPQISLVVPLFNEAEVIDAFFAALIPALEETRCPFTVLCVDDGSQDDTWARIMQHRERDGRIEGLRLARNFGKEAALTAGIDAAEGQVVVIIDADLQEPPQLISRFIERWREGFDMVYGARRSRNSDSALHRLAVRGFYRLFNWLSERPIPANAGDFRLLDRRLVDALRQMPERGRFMKGIFAWPGFTSVAVPFDRPQRAAGKSKFNAMRLFAFAFEGLFAFSIKPLRVASLAGLLISLTALGLGVLLIIRTLIFGNDVPGWTSLAVIVLVLGGIQLIALGLIGEYIGRILIETKGRPLYIVAENTQASVSPDPLVKSDGGSTG